LLHRVSSTIGLPSPVEEARPEAWLETEWGKPAPALCEQVLHQNGYAMVMLWAEPSDDDEDDSGARKRPSNGCKIKGRAGGNDRRAS
jgi:hypothetical protein